MADNTPDPLVVVQGSKNIFPQQGSWNMLDISNAAITGSLGALSRYSASRVNPYVALVGETLCSMFQLSHRGRANIDDAVEKLKVVGTLGKTLEIGFGIEDIVRVMAKTDQGRMCMALCAALSECYSGDMAVGVLLEMARLFKVDGQLMPSSTSWKELLAACAGILASSKFPLLAEHYMRLAPGDSKLGTYHGYESSADILRGCSTPKDIATALLNLASVTKGDVKTATFIGGTDAGWIAAVAEWFFDLKLVIYDQEGNDRSRVIVCHQNCDEEDAQVRIYYQHGEGNSAETLQLIGKSVTLSDVKELFKEDGSPYSSVIVSGRLEWKTALESTFTGDFRKLMKLRQSMGTAIGSAAVLFKGLARADSFFSRTFRAALTTYCDASYGGGFVSNALHWFPELRSLKEHMEDAAGLSLSKAREVYESSVETLRANCACLTCLSNSTGHFIPSNDDEDEEMTPAPNSDTKSEESDASILDWDPDRFCLVVVLETIISLSRALANVALEDKALLPTRSGLEFAYGRQLTQRRCANGGMSALREIGPIAFVLDFDNNFSFGPMTAGEHGIDVRMKEVLSLFSGREIFTSGGNFGAISSNGIIAFLGFLREASVDKEDVSRIHIIPGKIIHDGKAYPKLVDQTNRPKFAAEFRGPAAVMEKKPRTWNPRLRVEESYTGLTCLLELFLVGPASLVAQISGQTGLVTCRSGPLRSKVCRNTVPFSKADIENAISTRTSLEHGGKSILILDCRSVDIAMEAITCTTHLPSEYTVYIVRGECASCCIKAALSVDRPERPYFYFFVVP